MSKSQKKINGISVVFEEIQKTISAIGESKFISVLSELREDSTLTYQNEIVKQILKIVSKEFDISIKELLYGKSRLNDKTHALGIIAYILINDYKFSLKEVSFLLCKNNTNLSRYKKEVDNYDPNHFLDVERIQKFESIKHQLKLIREDEQKTRN